MPVVLQKPFLEDDAKRLEKWLQNGMHGKMQYMENYFELRVDPSKLVPGAKSVITLVYNYFPGKNKKHSLKFQNMHTETTTMK